MNHRKASHPSKRKCRYFVKDQCSFNAETCWYNHENATKQDDEFECNYCDEKFGQTSALMTHKKMKHPDKVSTCKKFSQGNCDENEKSCWFAHPRVDRECEDMETDDGKVIESVFCQTEKERPPDQMTSIMKMIKKLSCQVEELEKMTRKSQ